MRSSKRVLAGALALLAFARLRATGQIGVEASSHAARSPRLRQDDYIAYRKASVRAVLAYLQSPGPATLKKALETALNARETITDDALNDFFIAFCLHEAGDAAGEARALAPYSPEKADAYRFIFSEHRRALADGLSFLASPCGLRVVGGSGRNAADCPESHYEEDLGGVRERKDDSMRTILDQVGHGLLDNRLRFEPVMTKAGPEGFLALVGVKEGQVLADIGCGVGYLTFPAAKRVGPAGKVYAEDIDPVQIELIRYIAAKEGIGNVAPVLGSAADMGLPPGALDTALLVNVYRNILRDAGGRGPEEREAFLDGFFANIRGALKPGGSLVIADRLDSNSVFTVAKTVSALRKRGFRFAADKSVQPGRTAILFFER